MVLFLFRSANDLGAVSKGFEGSGESGSVMGVDFGIRVSELEGGRKRVERCKEESRHDNGSRATAPLARV